jgi:hypothetical protein
MKTMIANGQADVSSSYNPYRVLFGIYEQRQDWLAMRDLLLQLRTLYPNDRGLEQRIAEVEGLISRQGARLPDTARTPVDAGSFEPARSPAFPHGLEPGATGAASRAAAGLLAFLASHQPFALPHVSRLRAYRLSETMLIDAATRAHLELFRSGEDGRAGER